MRADTLVRAGRVGLRAARLDKLRETRSSRARSRTPLPRHWASWWVGKVVVPFGAYALIACSSDQPTPVVSEAGTPDAPSICSEGDFQKCVGSRGCVGARVCEHDEWTDCYCAADGDAAALGEAGTAGAKNGS